MRSLTRALLTAAMLVPAIARAQTPATEEIVWDRWGVPHIYAASEERLFEGMGWAQMENHAPLLLRLYGEARGRAAEYWGETTRLGEGAFIAAVSDSVIRLFDVPRRGAEWFAAETPAMQANIRAFVRGINAWATAHRDRIPADLAVVLPVRDTDVTSHMLSGLYLRLIASSEVGKAFRFVRQPVAPRAPGGGDASTGQADEPMPPGSTGWAIGPSRSASGRAMLMANPHLNWNDERRFHEQHLVAPGIDLYGATFVGTPGVFIGFNDRLGWTYTNNLNDVVDLYAVDVAEGGYRFGDTVRPFVERQDTMRVRTADGTTRVDVVTIRETVHGPIVAARGDRAVAMRVAGLERPRLLSQWWDMARSRTLAEFETALRQLQLPVFNVLSADADGHIFYLFNGLVPRRARGDWSMWQGVVDGSDPSLLWTDYHAYEELPRLRDPASGWLHNANDPPFTVNVPSPFRRDDFPPYLTGRGMGARAQRSAALLGADSSITFEELVAYKHDTRAGMADRVLDELLPLAAASPDSLVRAAGAVLARWDRRVDAESRGALLFHFFMLGWTTRGLTQQLEGWVDAPEWRVPWSEAEPTTTPRGIADGARAVGALGRAARLVQSRFGALDVPWGNKVRASAGAYDVPVSGAQGDPLGVLRNVGFDPLLRGAAPRAYTGDSWYFVAEFTPDGPRAEGLVAYGNSSWPESPHFGDQLELFAKKELRPLWRSRADVEANAVRRTPLPAPR